MHVVTARGDVTGKPLVESAKGFEVRPRISTLQNEGYTSEQGGS